MSVNSPYVSSSLNWYYFSSPVPCFLGVIDFFEVWTDLVVARRWWQPISLLNFNCLLLLIDLGQITFKYLINNVTSHKILHLWCIKNDNEWELLKAVARCQKLWQGARSCGELFTCWFSTELHQTETSEWKHFYSMPVFRHIYWSMLDFF